MTTELTTFETGDVLSYEVRIAAPPDVVWTFWVDPERMARWMGDRATLEPRPGGTFRLEYGSGDVAAGAFVELDAPHHLVFTWGWEADGDPVPAGASRIEVSLEAVDGGAATLRRLRHLGLPPESRAGHDEGWRYFLPRLVDAGAEAAPGSEQPQK